MAVAAVGGGLRYSARITMRTLLTLLAALGIVYLALGVILYLFQGSLVFLANLPGRALDGTPADIGLPFNDVGIATADGAHVDFVAAGLVRLVGEPPAVGRNRRPALERLR